MRRAVRLDIRGEPGDDHRGRADRGERDREAKTFRHDIFRQLDLGARAFSVGVFPNLRRRARFRGGAEFRRDGVVPTVVRLHHGVRAGWQGTGPWADLSQIKSRTRFTSNAPVTVRRPMAGYCCPYIVQYTRCTRPAKGRLTTRRAHSLGLLPRLFT